MIGVIARLKIQDGKQADFEALAKDLMAKVKANESGCTFYQLYKAKDSGTDYVFLEHYASQADLDAHGKTDYFLAAGPGLGACLAGAPEIEILNMIE